ncbi:hypothetical protein HPB52_024017 [Rhipicephalus sanguineus]|uniref:Uncharacterized protein n=1 Tax=Rhipicephalus sanguineus TaxID=34632 RepID=A0A9D4PT69_RHISA|nr:hypothetical protein HPB52_024017 [Rhipicephalus sanguineus]
MVYGCSTNNWRDTSQAAEDYLSVSEYEENAAATLSFLSYHIEQLQPETTADRGLPIPNDVLTQVGPAAKAIEKIEVNDASYADAIEILTNRYGNTRIIEQKYLESLRTLQPIRCSTDVTDMRNLVDMMTLNIRGLRLMDDQSFHTLPRLSRI